ncbi:hypothetical protein [Motiliproteus sp. MSK22-1]|uniref:hypothetical protein n=1 Tax=Motiliproteus sp. MSK22-1 TaxID=1897630 RepID=UPI000976E188|nr:hypothetical protein [Motiliproteus sp. MSK22-1]OMH25789.1 hypothetical protein BGP75_25020 [Motiliproteus sp. MSK22-1]
MSYNFNKGFQQLIQFKPEELLLNEEESLIVLKFIFKPTHHAYIDELPMNDHVRGYAQGLLVKAIDASYSVGYVALIAESLMGRAGTASIKIIKRFGKNAAKHWFKHATVHDLENVKIYDFVRDHLGRAFAYDLKIRFAQNNTMPLLSRDIAYAAPPNGPLKVWG